MDSPRRSIPTSDNTSHGSEPDDDFLELEEARASRHQTTDRGSSNERGTPTKPQPALTHRPRAQSRTSREALVASQSTRHAGITPLPTSKRTSSTPSPPADLKPFADQLIAIAEQLRRGDFSPPEFNAQFANHGRADSGHEHISEESYADHAASGSVAKIGSKGPRTAFAELARATYAKRRKRTAIFGDPELFGEPGWDILLDLYIAQAEDKPVSVSSACIGSASPPTTGLRWLGVLAEQGLVEREHDPDDQRRVLVRLTQKGLSAMDEYFSSSAANHGDRRAARA